ncbi:MAG TPA: lytic murein transglycosylase [Blastococcus sp.]|nr:lytic murein transglycosylase [Blastococcus sp.]
MRESTDVSIDPADGHDHPRGRHAAPVESHRPGLHRGRRRWFVLGAMLAGLTGLVSPPPNALTETAVAADLGENSPAADLLPAISPLSAGAPAGAIVLPAAPVEAAASQPAGPPEISGLAANGIPNVALNAYRVSAARMAVNKPSCGIDWSLLAGIGRIESNHGRFRGAVLNSDGTSTPKILGPALTGGQFAFIGDSDGGQWDGDTTYDRAMGPMQFIPGTWRRYAVDGNGDGQTDPFNINDAAVAAAHYLCVAGGDLRTLAGKRDAVMAYNHSDSYVAEVLALAAAYASGIPVADMPLYGDTTSPVPPPGRGYAGPAAPGPAIGERDTTPAGPDTTFPAQSGQQPGQSGPPPAGSDGSSTSSPSGSTSGGVGTTTTSGGSGTGTAPAPTGGSGGAPAPSGGGTDPAPAPAPAPLPAPAPVPLPSPPAPPPPPPPPVPGVTCTNLDPVTGLKLLPSLPLCP